VKEESISVTGNTVIDVLSLVVEKIKQDPSLSGQLKELMKTDHYEAARLKDGKKHVLITGHYRENFR